MKKRKSSSKQNAFYAYHKDFKVQLLCLGPPNKKVTAEIHVVYYTGEELLAHRKYGEFLLQEIVK